MANNHEAEGGSDVYVPPAPSPAPEEFEPFDQDDVTPEDIESSARWSRNQDQEFAANLSRSFAVGQTAVRRKARY